MNSSSEEPIKISIYESNGLFHMKYDHPECMGQSQNTNVPKTKTRRKNQTNKSSAATSEKPATETLYEIDLFCEICNHDYKSLMSLNRHMKTRKHLAQVAKLNEAKSEPELNLKWNYDPLINNYDSYNVNRQNYQTNNDSYFGTCTQYNYYDTENHMNYINNNNNLPNKSTNYDCTICYETFQSENDLVEHSHNIQYQCTNLIDSINDNFNLDDYINDFDQTMLK